MTNEIKKVKDDLIAEIDKRIADKIIEKTNADLLKKLINQAETINEVIMIAELGTTYKRTGFHFDKRLEKMTDTIKFFKKNEQLSFVQDKNALTHKLIIGDNYDALLNLLIEYRGKIDVIYIDPPYGKDSMGEFAQTNYDNAITRDNLLSMLYPRLVLARLLLSDTGVMFCSIDDKNQAYVKGLFDEVFEESNFVANLPTIMNLKGNNDQFGFAGTHEYTLVYAKKISEAKINNFEIDEEIMDNDWQEDEVGFYKKGANLKATGTNAPREKRPNLFYPIFFQADGSFYTTENDEPLVREDKIILPITDNKEMSWRWSKQKLNNEKNNVLVSINGEINLCKKQRPELGDLPSKKPKSLFYKPEYSSGNGTATLKEVFGEKQFNNPKPVQLINDIIMLGGSKSSIVLDFFAGSGTTGQAVLELNKQDGGRRQFILATANEITETTPNGIVNDVTSKRLKRVMTGECYDGTRDFKWNEKNKPLGDNLDVYDIATVAPYSDEPFEKIDETLYGQGKLGVKEKIKWVCENFEMTQKTLEDK